MNRMYLHGVNAIVELDGEERAIVFLLVRVVIWVNQSDLAHLRQVESRKEFLHFLRLSVRCSTIRDAATRKPREASGGREQRQREVSGPKTGFTSSERAKTHVLDWHAKSGQCLALCAWPAEYLVIGEVVRVGLEPSLLPLAGLGLLLKVACQDGAVCLAPREGRRGRVGGKIREVFMTCIYFVKEERRNRSYCSVPHNEGMKAREDSISYDLVVSGFGGTPTLEMCRARREYRKIVASLVVVEVLSYM